MDFSARMNRRQAVCAVFAGSALAQTSAQPVAAGTVVYGPSSYVPLIHLEYGEPKGRLVERLQAASALSGDPIQIELTDWSRALGLARAQRGGVLAVSYTPERATWLDYSDPLWSDDLHLVVRRAAPIRFDTLNDLAGKRLAMSRSTTGGLAFDAAAAAGAFQVVRTATGPERLRVLLAGRVDAVVIGSGADGLKWLLDNAPDLQSRRAEFLILPQPLLRDALHLAFHKDLRQGPLLQRLNAALRRLPPPAAPPS